MIKPLSLSLLLLTLLRTLTLTLAITVPSFNISRFLYPRIGHEFRPQPSPFLKDVLSAISERQKWNPEDVKVSELDLGKVRFGSSQRYEFRLRLGKSETIFEFRDEVSSWKKLKKGGEFESIVKQISSDAVLDKLQIEGPFELRVGGDDQLSLLLPLNTTHTGLKRILVGKGVRVEISGAREVSLFHAPNLWSQVNNSIAFNRGKSDFWSTGHSSCMKLLPVRISGSASVVAYMTRNPNVDPKFALLSCETIELLPDKCYNRNNNKKQTCPVVSLRSRIAVLEILARSLFGDRIRQSSGASFLKAKMKASTVVRFRIELKRNTANNDALQGTLAEWRTRATFERVWFEVVARLEGDRLKPLMIKKVRPFTAVDSSALSNLMANISFTKIPSFLLPPEALTLDVKW